MEDALPPLLHTYLGDCSHTTINLPNKLIHGRLCELRKNSRIVYGLGMEFVSGQHTDMIQPGWHVIALTEGLQVQNDGLPSRLVTDIVNCAEARASESTFRSHRRT